MKHYNANYFIAGIIDPHILNANHFPEILIKQFLACVLYVIYDKLYIFEKPSSMLIRLWQNNSLFARKIATV